MRSASTLGDKVTSRAPKFQAGFFLDRATILLGGSTFFENLTADANDPLLTRLVGFLWRNRAQSNNDFRGGLGELRQGRGRGAGVARAWRGLEWDRVCGR